MNENYVIIHGSFGSKDGNWFPWLKDELERKGKQVIVPQMPIGGLCQEKCVSCLNNI